MTDFATLPNKHQLIKARRAARRLTMQALYQWLMTGDDPRDVLSQFQADRPLRGADPVYFRDLLIGVPDQVPQLDLALIPFLGRSMELIDPVERAILYLATYELLFKPDVPYKVVINEAVDLEKTFGAEQGYRFINGVLDKVVRRVRPAELGRAI